MENGRHLDEVTQNMVNYIRSFKSEHWDVYEEVAYTIIVSTKDLKKFFIIEVEYMTVIKEYVTKDNVETPFTTLVDLRKLLA